ncbi:MAG: ankyrin repeat domain-containing protein [Alphaproteobacteria bacterium]
MAGLSKFAGGGGQNLMPEKLTEMLVQAILKNDARQIASVITQGANLALSDSKGNTPLIIAATDPREHGALHALLAAQAKPNQAGTNGKLPLHSVLRMKEEKIMGTAIELLFAAGADPNLFEMRPGEPPMTALQVAVASERSDKIFEKLLAGGADPRIGEDKATDRLSPLHILARHGRYPLLEIAFSSGVPIDHADYLGRTCLMWAARAGATRTIEVLLETGADPLLKDKNGHDVLTHAKGAPPDVDTRPLVKAVARAAKDYGLRKEVKDLRTEVDELKHTVEDVQKG